VWPGERFDSLPTGESQAAMPPNVTMCKPVHAIPGEMASVTVSGIPAGGTTYIAAGFRNNGNWCPGILNGACITVANPVQLGPFTADANGDVTFDFTLPASAPAGGTGYMQAVYIGGPNSTVSNVVAMDFVADDTDLSACSDADICLTPDDDGNGIPNVCEVSNDTVMIDFESVPPPEMSGFGGAEDATIVVDPTDPSNTVGRVVKTATAELWAGTTMGTCDAFGMPVLPFDANHNQMSLRVWSPVAGIPVRLKVEDSLDPTHSVETEAMVTVASAWETLTFDFTNQAANTAAIDYTYTYDKASVFFDFGTPGADVGSDRVYYMDDLAFVGMTNVSLDCPVILPGETLPITFDDANTTYTLAGFGGADPNTIVPDPDNAANMVVEVIKQGGAELWAGTTFATEANFAITELPLDVGNTQMTLRVRSERAGIPVRLKVEDSTDPTISVETEAITQTSGAWETLTFDFANEALNTAAFNPAATYDKVSVFFDFGTSGPNGGGGTFYFDDLDMAP
jgi:hypothetical protein